MLLLTDARWPVLMASGPMRLRDRDVEDLAVG